MSLLWLRLAVFLYGVAALAVLPAALYDRPRWRHLAIPATVAAVLFHFVSLAEMLNLDQHTLPVLHEIATHETESFLGLLLAVAFLAIYAIYRTIALGTFLLPICFLLGLLPAFRPGLETATLPGLHTGWLFLHIALLLAAYAALFVSLVASTLYLIQERRLKNKSLRTSRIKLPPLDTIDRIALRALLIGLPCMTAGLLIGAVLARAQPNGALFLRDPKILLAFAMWLAYIGMIHIRRIAGLRGRRAIYLSSFAFVVILAVYASNQLSAVHRFPTP